jgi:hypothetical protein
MGPDEGYDDCLVFGWRWQVPTSTGSRLWMHAMGMHPRGFITVGPHAVTDEVAVLELGVHVEMEMAVQEMAIAGEHWVDLGDYLAGLLTEEDWE